MSLFLNGTEFNDIMFNSVNTTGMFNGTTVWGSSPVYTLTLQNDGHGTLTADKITGKAGDTVILSPTYNTYYRFSGYNITGGSVVGNTFTFGENDATAQATFKVNAFTATGGFEKGSNITAIAPTSSTVNKYAILGSYTGDIPNEWYATSNRWKVTTTPSAYSITLNNKMSIQHVHKRKSYTIYYTAYGLIGNTVNQQQTGSRYNIQGTETWNYNKSLTTSVTGVYHSISAKFGGAKANGWADTAQNQAIYIATATNGTWTATGIAP